MSSASSHRGKFVARAWVVVLLVVAGAVGWRLVGSRNAGSDGGWQASAPPLAMPASGEPDARFAWRSAWQTCRIPRAQRFDEPLGSEHGALGYNAQAFWEMNAKRGGRHLGDDLNGIGGMNSDLGDPVVSTADGLVLYAGQPSPGWGNVVIVAHNPPDGPTLHSMYAHLERIAVAPGDLVARGGLVGTVGTANGYYLAHLHFEMRASDQIDIGAGYGMDARNRLDPLATIAALRHARPDDLAPSALARMLTPEGAPRRD